MAALIAEAREDGDPVRGAGVFVDAKFTCVACHKVGSQGGIIGPELTSLSKCMSPEEIVESVLWPRQKVKEGYMAIAVATADGKVIQGYTLDETETRLALREAATGSRIEIARADIEEVREQGSLMPEGLAEAMTPAAAPGFDPLLAGARPFPRRERRSAAGTCPCPGLLHL